MDRNGSNGGTPDHFQNDEEYATRHHIWVQRQETRHAFSRLETRLDDTFEEFRQQNSNLQQQQANTQGVLATLGQQLAQLLIRSNLLNSHASSSSRRTRSEAPTNASHHTPSKG
jgi:ABC-type Zn2+ transport system substrate-binding protein/surface adhesin